MSFARSGSMVSLKRATTLRDGSMASTARLVKKALREARLPAAIQKLQLAFRRASSPALA